MRAIIVLAMLLATHLAAAQEVGSHWKFDDGTGSATVRDYGPNKLNGTILDAAKCTWAREDDRGFFLNFSGGSVQVPNHPDLMLENGFSLEVRFSVNLEAVISTNFASIVTKGNTFQDGYSVMVRKNGYLLINLRGVTPSYQILPVQLKSNTDYRLKVSVGDGRVVVELDGKKATEYEIKGKLGILDGPLHFGSIRHYPFSGNIYEVKLGPCRVGELPPIEAGFQSPPIVDPPGTVVVCDFRKCTPAPAVGKWMGDGNVWFYRDNAAFMPYGSALHVPSSHSAEELVYRPELAGRFDVYAGVRATDAPMFMQIGLGDPGEYYLIETAPLGNRHRNMELLLDRDVPMNQREVRLISCGSNFYLGYLKFIPAANRRAQENPPDPAGKVTKGPRLTAKELDPRKQQEVRKKIDEGFFVERVYVEKRNEPTPDARSRQRGYILFNRNWMDLLFPVNVPVRDDGEIRLKAAAAPGEYEPVTFGLRGLRDTGPLNIRLAGDLIGKDGKPGKIEAAFAVVEPAVKRTTAYKGPSEFMRGPQYLEPAYPLALKKGQSRQYWITLRAPEGTPGGIYTGTIELTGGGQVEKIPLEFEVYPFKLDPLEGYDLGFWTTSIRTREQARDLMAAMAARNMTSIHVSSPLVLAFRGGAADEAEIDFENSVLPEIAEAFKQHRMPGHLYLASDGIWNFAARFPAEQRDAVYEKLIRQLEDYAKANQWPPIAYMSMDEVLSTPALLPDFIREVNLQKEWGLTTANDHIWYKTSRPYQREVDQAAGAIDIFINRFNTRKFWYVDSWETMEREAKQRGKKLVAYNSNNAVTFAQPAAMRFIGGWFFRTLGQAASGQLIWVFQSWEGNPYDDLDGTDWAYIYPPYDWRQGGPSLDFEAFREGADDLRYILTLENLAEEAERRKIDATEARQLLQSLAGSFDLEKFRRESVFFDSKWSENYQDGQGRRFAAGQYNLPLGRSFEHYDDARQKIAAAVIKLQRQLHQP